MSYSAQLCVMPVNGHLIVVSNSEGLGKQEEIDHYTNPENITRLKLDVEIEETEEMKKSKAVSTDNSRFEKVTNLPIH